MAHNISSKSFFYKVLLAFVSFVWTPLYVLADNITVQGSAPSSWSVDEPFRLSYIVNERATDIVVPEVDGLRVLMGPSTSSSSSHSIVNGQVSSSRQTTFTYVLQASKTGNFTVPPATIVVNGNKYTSNAVNIKIVGEQQSSAQGQSSTSPSDAQRVASDVAGKDIVLRQELIKGSVYEGEGVHLITKVYTRVDLNSLTEKNDPKLTEFVSVDMSPSQYNFHTELLNGVQYQVSELDRKVLIPQKSGKITIEPAEYEFIVKRRTGGGFFFSDVQLVRQKVKSNSLSLNVKPLPSPRPNGFTGGVGSYKFNVSVSPEEVDVDNSVTVRVSVEGRGNLKLISMPTPIFHQDFDTFDPSHKSDLNPTENGYQGKRVDEYLVIPRRDGEFEIPQLTFSYFDPQKGKYETVSKGPFSIKVNKGIGSQAQGATSGISFAGSGPEQVTYLGTDLRYLHRTSQLTPLKKFFVLSPLFWLLTLLPVAILLALYVYYRKRISDLSNISLLKSRKANKQAKKRLKQAAKFIKDNKREAFFDELMRALWGYLSDKLTLPLSVLTKDNAREKMSEHGISEEVAVKFMSLLDECEFARYAPASMTDSLDTIYQKAADVIEKIEKDSKK